MNSLPIDCTYFTSSVAILQWPWWRTPCVKEFLLAGLA